MFEYWVVGLGKKIVLDLFRGLSDYKVKVLRCFEGIQTSSEYIV